MPAFGSIHTTASNLQGRNRCARDKVPGLENASEDQYITDTLSNEACKFVTVTKDRPMIFLVGWKGYFLKLKSGRQFGSDYLNDES